MQPKPHNGATCYAKIGDDLVSQVREGEISYYHFDGLGSTRALTDASEDVTGTYNYEAFGNIIQQTGTTVNNHLFTGEQFDPNSGFYYLRARYYNPGLGRFVTTDPFGGEPFEPMSLHKYMYAHANPVMFVDPSGKSIKMAQLMTAISIQANIFAAFYQGVSHHISRLPPIEWHATSHFSSWHRGYGEVAFIKTHVSTTKKDGTEIHHDYEEYLIGFSYSKHTIFSPFSYKRYEFNIKTPGLFEYQSYVLQGICIYYAASWSIGYHGAGGGIIVSYKIMGMGITDEFLMPHVFVGASRGISSLFGWSQPQ